MRCLSFDTATKTGVCVGDAGSRPRSWSVDLGVVPWPERFSKTLRMTAHYIREFEPDLVAVEAFVGGPKANTDLAGLVACVLGEAARFKVRTVTYYPATIRKYFLGGASRANKTPIKSQVYARCKMLGWDPKDTDCSDSLALWDYALSIESRSHQITTIPGLFARGSK